MKKIFYSLIICPFLLSSSSAQNFWVPLNGPLDGNVYPIIADSTGIVLAGAGNGIFRSTDFGNSWDFVYPFPMSWGAFTFANSDTIYGTSPDIGFIRSFDKGIGWVAVSGLGGYCLVYDSDGIIYSGGIDNQGTGVFKSTDYGLTWEKKFDNGWNGVRSIIMTPDKKIFASCIDLGVVRSTDGGETWDTVNTGLNGNYFFSMSFVSPDILFCSSDYGLYKSNNWGNLWTNIYSEHEVEYVAAISEQNILIRTNGYGIWHLTNGGVSWFGPTLGSRDPFALYNSGSGNIFCSSYQFGVFRSSDTGMTWAQVGIPGTHITSIIQISNGVLFGGAIENWYSYYGQLYQSNNEGISWSNITNKIPWYGMANIMNLCSGPNDVLFIANGEYGIFRSTDQGLIWTRNINGIENIYVYSIAITNNGSVFAATESGCYKSNDNGLNWTHSSIYFSFKAFYIDPNGIIYTCSNPIKRSTNNGDSWESLGTDGLTAVVTSLAISSLGYIFAGTYYNNPPPYSIGGIFRSTDNGMTWERKSNGLTNYTDITKLIVASNNKIYAASNKGIYYSANDGEDWVVLNSGLPVNNIYTIFIEHEGYLLAGTSGNGIYKSYISVSDLCEEKNYIPQNHLLTQNYPNPFNPTTTITYQIPQIEFVSLKVYDILGREVATLVNEEKPAGSYTVQFNSHSVEGRNLTSGIYFYQLLVSALQSKDGKAGNYSETKKMILLR